MPGVPIYRSTLSFEAKGQKTFVCSRLHPSQNETHLPIPRAVLVASIMAGYPINVSAVMSANISVIARQDDSPHMYPNTIIEYLTDAKVDPRDNDTKVKPEKPFTWYSLMDASNPKKKVQPPTTTCQSDEPTVVAPETVDVPSTSAEPSSSATAMPTPLSTTSTATPASTPTSTLKPVPMPTHPLSALRVSQTLATFNNLMQTTIVKLSDLSSTVAAQSTSQASQVPSDIEETLKKILENQNTIMDTLVQHGSVIEELGKEVKKMRKSQASKKSVNKTGER
nr:microtubule-associated protein RP/EB family member 1-like [Nicotiana tomentosiformis]